MTKPQQPELHRSGHTAVDPEHAKETAGTTTGGGGGRGGGLAPVPDANQPGHHPEVEQDKPKVRARAVITSSRGDVPVAKAGPKLQSAPGASEATEVPAKPAAEPRLEAEPVVEAAPKPEAPTPSSRTAARRRFGFAFEALHLAPAAAFGVTPFSSWVAVDEERLRIRFGLWTLETPLDNVAGVELTGPYKWFKVIGPPHVSLADRGLTFATNASRGVCIRFRQPVRGLVPSDVLRHPAVTVTVDDPEALAALLGAVVERAA